MRKLLEERIRAVYPAGTDWVLDENQLEQNDYLARVEYVIKRSCRILPLQVDSERWSGYPIDEFAFTQSGGPSLNTWVWSMGNAEKIRWIKEHGSPYVVLWVRVSRVADYYVSHFNHWRPRGSTGCLDADCREEPNDLWRGYAEAVFEQFHDQGFLPASPELLREKVPFVMTWGGDEIPEDDPRWDDDDFEPDPVPAVIYGCLFGDE